MRLTTVLDGEYHVTIPSHRPLKVGTLRSILKAVAEHHDLQVEDLVARLEL